MTIINAQIKGGGTQPTGTKSITSNGVYDVTDFASADVQVPTTAPAHYIEKTVDADGQLFNGSSQFIDLTGVKSIAFAGLAYAYYGNITITTTPDLSHIETIDGNGMYNTFSYCTNLTGTIDMSGATYVSGGLQSAFSASGITGLNLSSVKYIGTCANICLNCSGLKSVDMSSVENGSFENAFNNCRLLETVSLPSLMYTTSLVRTFYGDVALTELTFNHLIRGGVATSMCENCSGLTTVSFPMLVNLASNMFATAFKSSGVTSISFGGLPLSSANLNTNFTNSMLQGVTGCTVHFPAEWQTAMSSWSNVTGGFGGTNTTVLWDLPNVRDIDWSFAEYLEDVSGLGGCTAITSADLSGITKNSRTNTALGSVGNWFSGCTSLVTAKAPSLTSLGGSANTFQNCTALTSADVSCWVRFNNSSQYLFSGCTSLVTQKFESLRYPFTTRGFQYAFNGCTALTDVYFPALYTNTALVFQSMLQGCTGVTVHLPANSTLTAANFGGTNTVVSKDQPSCFVLNGADSKQYYRNPKFDTATTLCWCSDQYEIEPKAYTSGTTDPVVGGTIYSDAACTDAVTTISSIS